MIALLAPVLLQAPAPVFAPPLDRPLAYSVREVREDGTRTQRFAVDRHVVFRRDGDGFTAEVTLIKATGDAGKAGEMFVAMARASGAARTVIQLDQAGKIVDVADLDAVWEAYLAAIAGAITARNPSRTATITTLIAPLRALPRAAKVARVGEMVAPLIADRAMVPVPLRRITVPTRDPSGRQEALSGTETIAIGPDRHLILERRASGTVAGSPRSMSLRRRIDPATGMVLETIDIETIEAANARLVVTRSTVLTL